MGFDDIPATIKENYTALAATRGVSLEVIATDLEDRSPHLAAWLRSERAGPAPTKAARTAPPKGRGSAKAATAAADKAAKATAEQEAAAKLVAEQEAAVAAAKAASGAES